MSNRRIARLGGLLSANRIPGRAPALMAMVLVTIAVVLLAGGDPGLLSVRETGPMAAWSR